MSRVFTRFHYQHDTDTSIVERVQDCDSLVDNATALRNEGLHGDKEMRHAARFPMVVVERYCNEKGITFDEWMSNPEHAKAMLNDSALAAFRVWEGRV